MKINHRARVVIGGLAVVALAGVISTSGVNAAAPPPINANNDHIKCTAVYGTTKFSVPLDLVGGQATDVAVKASVDGCTDLDNPNVKIKKSTLTGTIHFTDNFVTALQGIHSVTGSFSIKWVTASGAAKLVPTAPSTSNAISTINFSQINGSSLGVGGNFTDQYASLKFGNDAAHGPTAAPSVSGAFTGGNGGATTIARRPRGPERWCGRRPELPRGSDAAARRAAPGDRPGHRRASRKGHTSQRSPTRCDMVGRGVARRPGHRHFW